MKRPPIAYTVETWKYNQLGQAVASFLDRGRPDYQSATFGFICQDFDVEPGPLIEHIGDMRVQLQRGLNALA